jgi:hypothetical protein
MILVDVSIKGFRSIDTANIPEIGSPNVLIGKNNSGKSTILSEGESLQAEIARGAPRIRAAAGPLESESFLRATLAITAEPTRFAYIKTLELILKKEIQSEVRLLMRISPQAAMELATRQRTSRSAKETAELLERFLQNFDEDDFHSVLRGQSRSTNVSHQAPLSNREA